MRLGQFYLDPASDQWIRAVRLAAMQAGEDITGSAVVRWAIARAAGEVTPEQVIHELLAAPPAPDGAGPPAPLIARFLHARIYACLMAFTTTSKWSADMADDPQDVTRHAGQVVRRVLLRRNRG